MEAPSRFFTDHVPEEHLKAIGGVAVAFTWLEFFLESLIHVLADLYDDKGTAITAHMTTPLRLSAFVSLVKLKFEEDPQVIKEAESIVKEIKDSASERAKIVHAVWFPPLGDEPLPTAALAKARSGVEKSLNQMTVEEIELVKRNINGTTLRLMHFMTDQIKDIE